MMNIQLLVIDPQNDFMDIPKAALPVAGATKDMDNVAALIRRLGRKLSAIHVTLDSHHPIDIAHPGLWQNSKGESPEPGIMISSDDVKNRIWFPRIPELQKWALDYTLQLEAKKKFALTIWPEHCLIGTWGHNVYEPLADVMNNWARKNLTTVHYLTKGSNPRTEHYGAFEAEVVDPEDPSTSLNGDAIDILRSADKVIVVGEAGSHCVKTSFEQILDNIGDEHLAKLHLLTDCMSPVVIPNVLDFTSVQNDFLKKAAARGVKLLTSAKFLAA